MKLCEMIPDIRHIVVGGGSKHGTIQNGDKISMDGDDGALMLHTHPGGWIEDRSLGGLRKCDFTLNVDPSAYNLACYARKGMFKEAAALVKQMEDAANDN